MLLRLVVAVICISVACCSCTTIAYEGAKRPDNEVATICSDRTWVEMIDGRKLRYSGGNYSKYKVLPGEHSVSILLNDWSKYPLTHFTKKIVTIYFYAKSGNTYVTRPVYVDDSNRWRPEIVEREGGSVVSYLQPKIQSGQHEDPNRPADAVD